MCHHWQITPLYQPPNKHGVMCIMLQVTLKIPFSTVNKARIGWNTVHLPGWVYLTAPEGWCQQEQCSHHTDHWLFPHLAHHDCNMYHLLNGQQSFSWVILTVPQKVTKTTKKDNDSTCKGNLLPVLQNTHHPHFEKHYCFLLITSLNSSNSLPSSPSLERQQQFKKRLTIRFTRATKDCPSVPWS